MVDETVIDAMDEDFTPHIEYLLAGFTFFTYTYAD